MKLHMFRLLIILAICASCNGQSTLSKAKNNIAISVGEVVSGMDKNIWTIFQSKSGDYWFGSDSGGVYRFNGKTFINYSVKDGLSSNRVRGIQEDKKGNIYFSTLGGVDKFDGHTIKNLQPVEYTSPQDWKLQPDDLWFSIPGKPGEKGPYRYDGKNLYQLEFPKHYLADEYFKKHPANSWSPYEVYCIYKDRNGDLWFGTSNFGICHYNGTTFSWLYEDHLTNVPNGGSFGIRSILEDKTGKFWFCNTNYRYTILPGFTNDNGKILIKYTKEKGIKNLKTASGIDHIYFLSMIEDKNGDLWMATYNEGIWRYDGKNITHYPVKDGETDIAVISLYHDRKGNLWLGTEKHGVYKFNGKSFGKFKI